MMTNEESKLRSILIFNRNITAISETFIYRQIIGLARSFDVTLVAIRYKNRDLFPLTVSREEVVRWPGKFQHYFFRLCSVLVPSLRRVVFGLDTYRRFNKLRPDVIHAHYGWNGVLLLRHAQYHEIPLVVSFHGKDASEAALKNPHYRKALTELFSYASAIIVCSSHMIDSLGLSTHASKVSVVPYGVDTNVFAPQKGRPGDGKIRILHAGRLVEKKGVPDLIRVVHDLAKIYPGIELHIVGAGNELEVCQATAGGSPMFVFHGEQPNTVVREMIGAADIFVLNSRQAPDGDMEGLPNALLEAMSMAKAVVSTYHAGIPGAVTDGEDGMLVPEKDNPALRAAIERLVTDEDLRRTLGGNAREKILAQFSIERMNQRLDEIFKRVTLKQQSI